MAFLPGLLANLLLQKVAQSGARLVQLGFRVPDGTAHDACNLVVLIALNVVEHENRSVTGWQPFDGSLKVDAVHSST